MIGQVAGRIGASAIWIIPIFFFSCLNKSIEFAGETFRTVIPALGLSPYDKHGNKNPNYLWKDTYQYPQDTVKAKDTVEAKPKKEKKKKKKKKQQNDQKVKQANVPL